VTFISAKSNKARAKEINQYIFRRRENFRKFLVIWLAELFNLKVLNMHY